MARPKLPPGSKKVPFTVYLTNNEYLHLRSLYGSPTDALLSILALQPLPAPISTQEVKDTAETTKARKRNPIAKAACPAHTRLGKPFQPTCRQCLALN